MKKLLALLLAALLIVTLCACGDNSRTDDNGPGKENDVVIDKITDADGNVFSFESIDSETVKITKFNGPSTPHAVKVPSTLNEKTVTVIAEGAFSACSNITTLELPETLLEIEPYAFTLSAIQSVKLPKSLTKLGESAFANCTKLTTVTFAEDGALAEIPQTAFVGCALTELTIPASVESIGVGAFRANASLTTVTVSEGVVKIAAGAFQKCEALKTLTLPASVTLIEDFAFASAPKLALSGITCPAGSYAETYIAELNLPEDVEEVTTEGAENITTEAPGEVTTEAPAAATTAAPEA